METLPSTNKVFSMLVQQERQMNVISDDVKVLANIAEYSVNRGNSDNNSGKGKNYRGRGKFHSSGRGRGYLGRGQFQESAPIATGMVTLRMCATGNMVFLPITSKTQIVQ